MSASPHSKCLDLSFAFILAKLSVTLLFGRLLQAEGGMGVPSCWERGGDLDSWGR